MSYERHWNIGNGRLTLRRGDISAASVDIVVTAANDRLAGGGGVDGAVHRAAGPELLQACRKVIEERGRLKAGDAAITPGFNLSAGHVIHAVGPVRQGDTARESLALESAYAQSLDLAYTAGAKSIAFPAVSCGVYGYPVREAAEIALRTVSNGLTRGKIEHASFYLFSEEVFTSWHEIAETLFGPSGS